MTCQIATDPDGNVVEVNEDFDATRDLTGRFPVKPGHWTIATLETVPTGITNREAGDYRGFTLHLSHNARSGQWDGMAKGLGTVIFSGYGSRGSFEETTADLKRRIDLGYERSKGVFAGR